MARRFVEIDAERVLHLLQTGASIHARIEAGLPPGARLVEAGVGVEPASLFLWFESDDLPPGEERLPLVVRRDE